MSRYAMEWAKSLDLIDAEARLLLLILADEAAGPKHEQQTSSDKLGRETGLSPDQVADTLGRLVELTLITCRTTTERISGTSAFWRTEPKIRLVHNIGLCIPSAFRTQATPVPRGRVSTEDVPTAVYRLYDEAGGLLYIGKSDQPEVRFSQHERAQIWWREVVTREVVWYPTARAAEAEEDRAIPAERPMYNISGLPLTADDTRHVRKRYAVVNRQYARFDGFVKAIRAEIKNGIYDLDPLPEAAILGERYGVDAVTAEQALRFLERAFELEVVDEKYYRLGVWR